MIPPRRLLSFLLPVLGIVPARGHQTLAEMVEVNLHDPATIRVEFTIHAPELPTPAATGLDPSAVDPTWLTRRGDDEIAQLRREAEAFIRATFSLGFGDTEHLAAAEIRFEPLEFIRQPPPDTKLPAGCLLATVLLVNPGPPATLRVGFGEKAQKRLLLSISRPAAFPEVRDVAPGGSFSVTLPAPPPPPPPPAARPLWPALAAAIAVVASAITIARLSRARRRG